MFKNYWIRKNRLLEFLKFGILEFLKLNISGIQKFCIKRRIFRIVRPPPFRKCLPRGGLVQGAPTTGVSQEGWCKGGNRNGLGGGDSNWKYNWNSNVQVPLIEKTIPLIESELSIVQVPLIWNYQLSISCFLEDIDPIFSTTFPFHVFW